MADDKEHMMQTTTATGYTLQIRRDNDMIYAVRWEETDTTGKITGISELNDDEADVCMRFPHMLARFGYDAAPAWAHEFDTFEDPIATY